MILIQSFIHLRPRSAFILLFCTTVCVCVCVCVCVYVCGGTVKAGRLKSLNVSQKM